MAQKQFNAMMNKWLTEQQEKAPADWSQEPRTWAEENGIIACDTNGKKMYRSFCTREQMVVFLHRLAQKIDR